MSRVMGKSREELIVNIVREIDRGEISLCAASKKYGIPKSTLSDKYRRIRENRPEGTRGRRQVFSVEIEERMTKVITVLAKWGFPFTKKMVLNVVQEFVKDLNLSTPFTDGRPGDDWFVNFCKRNNLKLKNCESLQSNRQQNTADPFIIYDFYDKLKTVMDELELNDKPDSIWNLDESGFCHDPSKTKGLMNSSQNAFRVIMGSGKLNTTILACCSASGRILPPLIIFKAKALWTSWRGNNDLSGVMYSSTPNGFITSDVFSQYFNKICELVSERPLLLVMDGHITHLSPLIVERALAENITILVFPPHTTDLLQPLDRTVFAPLKSDWDQELIEWQLLNNRAMTKSEFSNIITTIWKKIKPKNIIKGFETTGIYPFNPSKYPTRRLNPEKLKAYEARMSATGTSSSTPIHSSIASTSTSAQSSTNSTSMSVEPFTPLGQTSTPTVMLPTSSTNSQSSSASTSTGLPTQSSLSTSSSEDVVSPGTKFEKYLLAKINKTSAPTIQRRKIKRTATVITTEEFSEESRKANEKPKVHFPPFSLLYIFDLRLYFILFYFRLTRDVN